MGNSTGSMLYLFVIVIVLWIIGASVYSLIQWLKKRRTRKMDEQTSEVRKENPSGDMDQSDKEE